MYLECIDSMHRVYDNSFNRPCLNPGMKLTKTFFYISLIVAHLE